MRKLTSENGIKKGPWTAEEDRKLIQYVQTHGPGKWQTVPKNAGLQRCGKSCRLRWTNYLRPDIKRGRFSFEEEETIIQLHSVLGNKWSAIAARLPGRTDNEIKNYWNTHIRKKLHQNRIDPVTSTPGIDFNLLNLINLQTLLNPQVLRLATILASLSNNANRDLFCINHINPLNSNDNQKNPNFVFYQSHLMQANEIQYLQENLANINGDTGRDISTNACLAHDYSTIPNYNINQATAQASDSFQRPSYTENGIPSPSSQKFDYCSVLSSPISSPTPLTSSTTFINNSGTGDEPESYWSNMFK